MRPVTRGLLIATALFTAATLAFGLSLLSLNKQIRQHAGWLDTLEEARRALPDDGSVPEPGALTETLHDLEIVLPQIEAAETTSLTAVRRCTEATLKVVNTSMEDSPRRDERAGAIIELGGTLDELIPEVEDALFLILRKSPRRLQWTVLLGGIAAALAVATIVSGRRRSAY